MIRRTGQGNLKSAKHAEINDRNLRIPQRRSNADWWYQMGLPKFYCPYLPIQISSLRVDLDPSLPPIISFNIS